MLSDLKYPRIFEYHILILFVGLDSNMNNTFSQLFHEFMFIYKTLRYHFEALFNDNSMSVNVCLLVFQRGFISMS